MVEEKVVDVVRGNGKPEDVKRSVPYEFDIDV